MRVFIHSPEEILTKSLPSNAYGNFKMDLPKSYGYKLVAYKNGEWFKKIESGVLYYNNPQDPLSRLELLGGSITVGNDGVKEEITQTVHTLNKNQLNKFIKEYVIY